MKRLLLCVFSLLLVFMPSLSVSAAKSPVKIYEFYGNGCPHCTNSFVWFDHIEEEYGDYFDLVKFEVWYDQDNADLMFEVGKALGKNVSGVPFIVIGDKPFIGFGDSSKQEILDYILSEYEKDDSERSTVVSDVIDKFNDSPSKKEEVDLSNDFITERSGALSLIIDSVLEDTLNNEI